MRLQVEASDVTFSVEDIDRLERHVNRRVSRRLRSFQILAQNDGLVLRGRADTYYAKQLAQHAIMEATQIPIAANEIEVA